MNKHLPPSNVRELDAALLTVAPTKPAEQFFILRGRKEPFIDGDLMDRAEVIQEVANDCETLRQVIAIDLANGTSRDATDDITSVVIERWAQDGKELSRKQRDWVAELKGEVFANCFRLEEA